MSHTIYMLPCEDWKALRIISFSIEGMPANFPYQRSFLPSQLQPCSAAQTNLIEQGNDSLCLPLDHTDSFLLSWFKVIDKNAVIHSKLLMFDSEVRDLERFYSGLPAANIQMYAFPNFGVQSFEEMKKYVGQPIVRFYREYKVSILGKLPANKQLSVIAKYKYSKMKQLEKMMRQLDTEITTII